MCFITMIIAYFRLYLSPTPSFTSRCMHLFSDWVAPLHPQLISGADTATLWAGLCGRKVITMSCFLLYITRVPACVMRKVDTTSSTLALPLFPHSTSRGLCTGRAVVSLQCLDVLD